MLQTHQQYAIEEVETGFNFAGLVLAGFGTEFDYEWQSFVELLVVVGFGRVVEKSIVERGELAHSVAIDLQVS